MSLSSDRSLTAKAVTYNGRGDVDVIEYLEHAVRAPGPDEVRIAVKAAAVNPTDILARKAVAGAPAPLYVPGMDAAGTIESIGSAVSRLQVGQTVMAVVNPRRPEGGAQAQYIVVPAASVVAIPERVSLIEAATLPMNGLTALRALDLAGLRPSDVFAVSGGAGLLASYAIPAAKRQGLTVIADARPDEIDLVRSYGADMVVERGPAFADAIRAMVPEGASSLLDTAVLGESAFGAIDDGGVYLPVRGWSGKPGERGIDIRPVFVSEVLQRTEWLEQLRALVDSGDITLRVTGEYAPTEAADAQNALDAGGLRGRPVIVF